MNKQIKLFLGLFFIPALAFSDKLNAAKSFGGLGLDNVSIASQVGVQLLAVVVTILWSAGFSYLILKGLDKIIGIRVTPEQEVEGLDIVLHEEKGYHDL